MEAHLPSDYPDGNAEVSGNGHVQSSDSNADGGTGDAHSHVPVNYSPCTTMARVSIFAAMVIAVGLLAVIPDRASLAFEQRQQTFGPKRRGPPIGRSWSTWSAFMRSALPPKNC